IFMSCGKDLQSLTCINIKLRNQIKYNYGKNMSELKDSIGFYIEDVIDIPRAVVLVTFPIKFLMAM
ncbi:9763_t:CDS:1, partial [Cetraspora pellucida]